LYDFSRGWGAINRAPTKERVGDVIPDGPKVAESASWQ
jgi:hypothetical protein